MTPCGERGGGRGGSARASSRPLVRTRSLDLMTCPRKFSPTAFPLWSHNDSPLDNIPFSYSWQSTRLQLFLFSCLNSHFPPIPSSDFKLASSPPHWPTTFDGAEGPSHFESTPPHPPPYSYLPMLLTHLRSLQRQRAGHCLRYLVIKGGC